PGLPVTIRPPFEPCANAVRARSISPPSRISTGRTSIPSDGAAAWITLNWAGPAAMADSRRTTARVHPPTFRWAAMVVRVPAAEQEGAQAVPAAHRPSLLVAARL